MLPAQQRTAELQGDMAQQQASGEIARIARKVASVTPPE
jgi:hypothetical protein